MHVVSTTTIVTCVFAKVQKLFDIQVPSFQVGANRTFTLAALIYRNRRIADDFQKRDYALALTVGAFDMAVGRANVRPVISKSACPLRQFCVVGNALENVVQIIRYGAQVTTT